MEPTDERAQWLSGLASHLASRQAAILEAWRFRVDADPEQTTSASLPRGLFNDHIPHVLETFVRRLRAGLPRESPAAAAERVEEAEAHGLQRWQQGYRLREVTREWSHLQRCLLDELHHYAAAHRDVAPPVLHAAYRGLVALCSEGVTDSTSQYFHLEQVEAVGQMRDLSTTLDQLRELERERAELWRQAAHDLRGNLGVVTNATAGLSLAAIPEPMREKLFRLLQKGVSSVHAMLEDVMSLARLQAGQEQRRVDTFDVAALCRDLCESFHATAREQGLFLESAGPDRLQVVGDAIKIRRIGQNLVLNALKYTRVGGVTVSWGDSRVGDAGRWMMVITDTGPGIHAGPGAPIAEALEVATHEAEQIQFWANHQEDGGAPAAAPGPLLPDPRPVQQVRGEGVGLSIVKRLCDLLDASVEVESIAGQGTSFRVVLPRNYPEFEAPGPR
ncbi:MAG: HAMP domain-containing sensor histidine kinase [Planctomycetota bacterium]